jgi:hypothetical protein
MIGEQLVMLDELFLSSVRNYISTLGGRQPTTNPHPQDFGPGQYLIAIAIQLVLHSLESGIVQETLLVFDYRYHYHKTRAPADPNLHIPAGPL